MKQKASDVNVYVPKEVKKEHLKELAKYRETLYLAPQLRSMFIEMTLACNEHCRHCGSSCGDIQMKDQLTNDEIIDMLVKLKEQVPKNKKGQPKLPFLNVTGGEPLLRKDFINLMTQIHELGYEWGMTSNGLLIDEKMAKDLKKAGMYSVSISIDGLKETHDWFRNSVDSYEKGMNALRILLEQGFANVMATTVVHKKNIDELEELYKIMKETKVDCWRVINVDPIGRALTDDEIRLDIPDYKRIFDFIYEKRAKDTEMEISYGCNHYLGYKYERELRPWYFFCNAGVYTAGIFYNGDIGACLDIGRHPSTIQGNVRKDTIYDTWINKFEIFRRNKAEDSEKCSVCKHKKFCGGGGFHTWDIETNMPRVCMMEMIKDAKAIEKAQKKDFKKKKNKNTLNENNGKKNKKKEKKNK